MEWLKTLSTSERVTLLENDLEKSLKDLQEEIEDGKIFLSKNNLSGQSFSSIPTPNDGKYFRNERLHEIKKYLQVDEAKQLVAHSKLMNDEIKSCLTYEYNKESIALLLHQFFVNRTKELIVCKQLHMNRWAKFCEHTKAIEKLYPYYQKRISDLIDEYNDSVTRAQRLSKAREACLLKSEIPSSIIKEEDLLIYTRWMICYFHSIKKFQSFLKLIEWVTQSHLQFVNFAEKTLKSTVDEAENKRNDIKLLNPLNINKKLQKTSPWKTVLHKVNTAHARKLDSIPVNSTDLADFSDQLNQLLTRFGINMHCGELKNSSDEMDMFNLSLRKFKKLHFKLEQQRKFTVSEMEGDDESILKMKKDEFKKTYKRQSNWVEFIEIKPETDGDQLAVLTKLREQNNLDELLVIYSKFLHVESNDTVLYLLREHMKQVEEHQRITSSQHMTSFNVRSRRSTKDIWNTIFDISVKGKPAKDDFLEFDDNVLEDEEGKSSSDFDISTSVEKLGLQDDDIKTHPIASNGSYMSYLVLRHLKIKEDRAKCLHILNYFRSVERTITINHVQLSFKQDTSKGESHAKDTPTPKNIGNHQYIHNTPVDCVIQSSEFMSTFEVENHDDFYMYDSGYVYVKDQTGVQIMYDAALNDFRELESEVILIGSCYIQKSSWKKENVSSPLYQNEVDINKYSSQCEDRFALLSDMWNKLYEFVELKKQLLDCYLEVYHHIFDVKEKENLAKIISTLIYKKPRFDFNEEYFMKTLKLECQSMSSYVILMKNMINEHISDQRNYVQKLYRDDKRRFGFPLNVVPVQNIVFQTDRPILEPVYMLEFHPSLSMISLIPGAIKGSYMELLHMHQPFTTVEKLNLEVRLLSVLRKLWLDKKGLGCDYSNQIRKDVFSDVFIEDPIFVCDIVNSLCSSSSSQVRVRGSHSSLKEESKKMLQVWLTLLEVITFRHRLIENVFESNILLSIYVNNAVQLGLDECHAYMRPVSFDFAKKKVASEKKPLSFKQLVEDESKLDRYIPSHALLSIMELDEKHASVFNVRQRDGLLSLLQGDNMEKLRLTLLTQVVEKHLLTASVRIMDGCLNVIRSEVKKDEKSISSTQLNRASLITMTQPSSALTGEDTRVTKEKMIRDVIFKKLYECFLSLQPEKCFYRDAMLNQFLLLKEKRQLTSNDEINKLKRQCIQDYCLQLNMRTSQHALRAQIIAEGYSMKELFRSFPVTKEAHFMFGEENNSKNREADALVTEPGLLRRRPRKVLSDDGTSLLNLWYIPHYSEVLSCYNKMADEDCNAILHVILRLITALHEICQYLCAHACCGSSYARMGSRKLEYSGITADWGGTEGIGTELREIQKQINVLVDPTDPVQVAYYLERKRDVLFLEYKVVIDHSCKETFLTSHNAKAFKIIDGHTEEAISALSDTPKTISNVYQLLLPAPLSITDKRSARWFPWRHFMNCYDIHHGRYWSNYRIGYFLQLPLAGMKDIDRSIVHGDILEESLLLEDVISTGKTLYNLDQTLKRPHSSKLSPCQPSPNNKVSQFSLSWSSRPLVTVEFLREFLLMWCQLENLKQAWAALRMNVSSINSFKLYESFKHLYKQEVLQAVFKHFTNNKDTMKDIEYEDLPESLSEYVLKVHQITRLLENIATLMINESLRKVSRDHTFAINEKSRDEHTMPTDLWKSSSMKENLNLIKPDIVEIFVHGLSIHEHEGDDVIQLDRNLFENSLMQLGSACMNRERQMFLNYATFFENLLRQQNQRLFVKEQEIDDLHHKLETNIRTTDIDVACGQAEKTYDLIVEITALRSRISETVLDKRRAEEIVSSRLKEQYTAVVSDLFDNAFGMKKRFEQFQLSLYDDVKKSLTDVRKLSVEKVKNVRVKYSGENSNVTSQRLIQAEKLRDAQKENNNLAMTISKLKYFSMWNRMKSNSKLREKVDEFDKESSRTKKEHLEKHLLYEEKELLLKEEQAALKKLVSSLEKESDVLRKQLQKEQKLKEAQSHSLIQEAQSLKHLELAKSSNLEKLVSELEQKEKEIEAIKSSSGILQTSPYQMPGPMKRILQQTLQQMEHERNLKLTAFERVDELQRQVHELEMKVMSLVKKEKVSHHETCFPLVPGGRVSPQKQRGFTPSSGKVLYEPRRPMTCGSTRPKSGLIPTARPKSVSTKIKGIQSEILLSKKHLKKLM